MLDVKERKKFFKFEINGSENLFILMEFCSTGGSGTFYSYEEDLLIIKNFQYFSYTDTVIINDSFNEIHSFFNSIAFKMLKIKIKKVLLLNNSFLDILNKTNNDQITIDSKKINSEK